MAELSWQKLGVQTRIDGLEPAEKRTAEVALQWLLANCRGYRGWFEAHSEILAAHPNDLPKLLPSAILECFVESALWPWLYPFDHWCEPSVKAAVSWSRPFSGFDAKRDMYSSEKGRFIAKLLSDVLDYSASYELWQFHFDRYVLHDVKVKSGIALSRNKDGHCFYDNRYWAPCH